MVTCMAMTVVGGRYRVSGAIFGALALVHLPEWFRFLDKYNLIAYGAALLIMIVLAPAGIVGLMERVRQRYWPEKLPAAPRSSPIAIRPRAKTDGPLLQVGGLSKSFGGVRAVSNVSFDIGAREIVGLIGPNGSGKTTVINLITGFYKPDAGSVRIHGRNITAALPFMLARSGIARTFQNINLIDEMTALDNVAVARAAMLGQTNLRSAFLSGASGMQVAREHAMSLLERLGIGDVAMAPCGGLAHGIKRKVEIARALALEPELLLLDEPAAGLNALEQADLSGRLRTLTEEGLTLLVVEHNMPFLRAIAQRMICFDQGELLTVGTPEEVCRNPRVLEAYLGMDAA
jgi:branched-chain amino acid transport system permease protein